MQIAEMVQRDIDGLVQIHRSIESEKGSADEQFQDWLSSINHSADPPKKSRWTMTWDKLQKHLSQGFGMGHGAEYRPWLILRRKNPSKTSNQLAAHLFPLRRDAWSDPPGLFPQGRRVGEQRGGVTILPHAE